MAVIQAARKFEGSNFDQSSLFAYIKPSVRQLKFDKNNNKDGIYVVFMPAFAVDGGGNGRWFKAFPIRNNFGADKLKKSYYVADVNKDPVSYFERSFKGRYPEQAKVVKAGEGNNNTKFPIYPAYGHMVQRVVYNVGILKALTDGLPIDKVVHVLDLPAYKGADQLQNWMNNPQPDGSLTPMINDPTAAIAVFVKLVSEMSKDGGWTLSPSMANRYQIPDAYADADNLYNLDDIFIEKSNDELIGDLRTMYPAGVFDACMDGFPGFKLTTVFPTNPLPEAAPALPVTSLPAPPAPVALPNPPEAPAVVSLPNPPASTAPAIQPSAPPVAPVLPANPVATGDTVVVGNQSFNKADLRAFLESKNKPA